MSNRKLEWHDRLQCNKEPCLLMMYRSHDSWTFMQDIEYQKRLTRIGQSFQVLKQRAVDTTIGWVPAEG